MALCFVGKIALRHKPFLYFSSKITFFYIEKEQSMHLPILNKNYSNIPYVSLHIYMYASVCFFARSYLDLFGLFSL